MKSKILHTANNIIREKCPHCEKGEIFYPKGRIVFNLPRMRETCNNCGYRFEIEPGYFLGAMYISYGLTVFEGIVVFLLSFFFLGNLSLPAIISIIASVIVLLSMRNFRMSRVMWMYIFPG